MQRSRSLTLSLVENAFNARHEAYDKDKDGNILFLAESEKSIVYPVRLTPKGLRAEALFWFPGTENLIANPKGLCAEIDTWDFKPKMQFGFDYSGGLFYSQALVDATELWPGMAVLTSVCDFFLPMLQSAGRTGKWDKDLVKFRFTSQDHFLTP